MGSGGGGTSTQYVKSETSNLPAYAQPYYTDLLNRAQANLSTPYQPYQDASGNPIPRIAGFTPQQQQVQQNVLNQQTPSQFGTGSQLATAAGIGALNASQYNPNQFNAQQIGQPNLNQYSMQQPGNVQAGSQNAPQMGAAQTSYNPNLTKYQMQQPGNVQGNNVQAQNMQAAQTGYNPNLTAYQMGNVRDVAGQNTNAPTMQAAQSGYRPDLQAFQMGAARDVQAQQVSAQNMQGAQTQFQANLERFQMQGPENFGSTQARQYMSPFAEAVMEPQKREAIRSAKQAQIVQDLGASRQGTYGGSRQLLAGLERERNLGQQLGDIDAKGRQSAFENAQQQFERDRTAGMTAQ